MDSKVQDWVIRQRAIQTIRYDPTTFSLSAGSLTAAPSKDAPKMALCYSNMSKNTFFSTSCSTAVQLGVSTVDSAGTPIITTSDSTRGTMNLKDPQSLVSQSMLNTCKMSLDRASCTSAAPWCEYTNNCGYKRNWWTKPAPAPRVVTQPPVVITPPKVAVPTQQPAISVPKAPAVAVPVPMLVSTSTAVVAPMPMPTAVKPAAVVVAQAPVVNTATAAAASVAAKPVIVTPAPVAIKAIVPIPVSTSTAIAMAPVSPTTSRPTSPVPAR